MKKSTLVIGLVLAHGCANVLALDDAELDPAIGKADDPAAEPGGGGQASSADGGGGAGPALCESYCAAVAASCTGPFAVYTTQESCLAVCALWEPGPEGDETGNTVRCRLRNAEAAAAEPSFYCPIAGPTGNGVCGTPCDALCGLAEKVCVGEAAAWANAEACRAECEALPDLGTYGVDPSLGMYEGEHLQCRVFHGAAAAVSDADLHCEHVAGAPPCVAATEG